MQGTALYPRYLGRHLLEALEDSPVVLIHGPRQCGKTTFAQSVVVSPDSVTGSSGVAETAYWYVSFDDDVARAGAQSDPMGFVADLPERVILDEVQRVPEIFSALKLVVGPSPYAGALPSHRLDQCTAGTHAGGFLGWPDADRPAPSPITGGIGGRTRYMASQYRTRSGISGCVVWRRLQNGSKRQDGRRAGRAHCRRWIPRRPDAPDRKAHCSLVQRLRRGSGPAGTCRTWHASGSWT